MVRTTSSPASRKEATYAVGYGKPPVQTQFKKGQSGNPRGRPRRKPAEPPPGEDDLSGEMETLLRVMRKQVTIELEGRPVKMSQHEAMVQAMAEQAMRGDVRAYRLLGDAYARACAAEAAAEQSRAATESPELARDWVRFVSSLMNEAKHRGIELSALGHSAGDECEPDTAGQEAPDPAGASADCVPEPSLGAMEAGETLPAAGDGASLSARRGEVPLPRTGDERVARARQSAPAPGDPRMGDSGLEAPRLGTLDHPLIPRQPGHGVGEPIGRARDQAGRFD